ncbi:MAG: chromosome partitioning protein ParA, partial [Muribaculaceae bacterium]|nr:chromosome partitioning protein ParA [Muribaculaceae bacterium]
MSMSVNSVHTSAIKGGNEPITVKEFTKLCLRNWMWILSSLIIFLACGYLYIKCQQPEYERTEEILVKDQEAGGGIGGMASTFASMGLVSGNSNVYNELITITSPAVMGEVVDRLRLDVDYFKKGSFHGTDLFGTNLPFYVDFLDLTHDDAANFTCDVNPDGTLRLYKFISYDANNKKVKHKETVENVKIGEEISTPLGKIYITANPLYKENPATNKEGKTATITVTKNDLHSAIETYSKKVSGELKEEYADVIALVMKDVSVERAEAVLTEIVNVYNENYVSDKNKIAKATSLFIEERLHIIEQELGSVDANIA